MRLPSGPSPRVASGIVRFARRLAVAAVVASIGCAASDDVGPPTGQPSRSVSQGGPQDIGEFRRVLSAGSVPARTLLDPVGFFAEHAVDLPPADCGDAVCFHPMLAVAPRFDGGNWSMAFVAANTAVDPGTLPRAPRHLILVVEASSRTREVLRGFSAIADALVPALTEEDRVSMVQTGMPSAVTIRDVPPSRLAVLGFQGQTSELVDLYAAIAHAGELAAEDAASGRSQRILLFSRGVSNIGVLEVEPYRLLAQRLAAQGVAISSFGMGDDYRREIPTLMAEVGLGNYYFAESTAALQSAVRVEAETAFVPLARELTLALTARPGYRIGAIYGARSAEVDGASVRLQTPTLFIGARQGSNDVAGGRRGGGGGWFVELVAEVPPGQAARQPAEAFTMDVSYQDAGSGAAVARAATLVTPLGVGQNPEPTDPYFSDRDRAKPFMMLNMYLALDTTLALYESGDCSAAIGVAGMMQRSYTYWTAVYDDADVTADWELLQALSQVIQSRCDRPAREPPLPRLSCYWF